MTGLLLLSLLAQAPAEPRVTFSGYMQPQYETRTVDDETRDRALFRRMVVSLDVSLSPHWRALFQVDGGPLASGGDRPIVKNAYIQFTGWASRGLVLTIGNQKMPFARPLLVSSSRRALLERPFTGDRAYGAPSRAPSVKVEGLHRGKRLYWSMVAGETRQVPNADEIRIDGPAEAGSAGNQGPIVGGRIEIHPLGETVRDHGDLERGPLRFSVGAGTYGWWNDEDVAPHGPGTVDASTVAAFELSAAARGHGFSFDAEYDRISADAVEGSATLGLFRDGRARLHKASAEGGYMLVTRRLEALASLDMLHSPSFDETWRRFAVGMNWYVNGHDTKFSLMHRESFNERGASGARSHATYLQAQFAF